MIPVNALKEFPEFTFSSVNEDTKFCGTRFRNCSFLSSMPRLTVVLYLSISASVDRFKDIVQKRVGVFQGYTWLALRRRHCTIITYDDPSSSNPSGIHLCLLDPPSSDLEFSIASLIAFRDRLVIPRPSRTRVVSVLSAGFHGC